MIGMEDENYCVASARAALRMRIATHSPGRRMKPRLQATTREQATLVEGVPVQV